MWGNRLGWMLAVGEVVLVAGLILLMQNLGDISPPSSFGLNAENYKPVELPVSPKGLVIMDKPCDAGEVYRQAIADVISSQYAYDRLLISRIEPGEGAAMRGVQLLLEGAPCTEMKLFAAEPEKFIRYESDKPTLEALEKLAKVAIKVALLYKAAGNDAEAIKYFDAIFALGAKLYEERVVFAEMRIGIDMMYTASTQLEDLAKKSGNESLRHAAGEFRAAVWDYNENTVKPIWRAISSIDDNVIKQHVGDVFVIARNSKDPMWRVEATLKLGRIKYNAGGDRGRAADHRGARRVLKELVNDPDPRVRLAAKQALDLTIQDYRRLN